MTTDTFSRERLVAENQGLVRALAGQIHRGLPHSVDLDDLIGYGQVGLHEAALAYDPERGGKFSTFAYYRIRGAVFDGLAKMAWFNRARKRRAMYEQAANELLKVEASTAVGGNDPNVNWLDRVAGGLAMVYLASHQTEDSGSDVLVDPKSVAPDADAIEHETKQILAKLVEALPTDAGILIKAVYFQGLTLQEAGQQLGISKAWASRLHAKTLDRMARALKVADGCET